MTIEKSYAQNFYILDTETSGFDHNEPIQVAALRFENGVEVERYNRFFLPQDRITESAKDTHGLTRKKL